MGLRDLFRRGPTYAEVHEAAFSVLSERLELARASAVLDAAQVGSGVAVTGAPPGRRNVSPQVSYGTHVWSYVMANRVASTLAMTGLRGVGAGGQEVSLDRLTERGDFIQPNPRTSMLEHKWVLGIDAVSAGENYELVLDDGLWRVDPSRMTPVPSKTKWIERYDYTTDDGRKVPFKPEVVIHRKLPNPINNWHGIGPGGVAVNDVRLDQQMDDYEQGFFRSGLRPSGVVQVKEDLDEATRIQIGRELMANHGGSHGHWRIPVLTNGATLTEGGESHREMEYLGGRKALRDRFAALFGVPPFLAGDTDSVAYANATAQMQVFVRFTVLPLARWMAHGWNNNRLLFPDRSMQVEFDEKELFDLMTDPASVAAAAGALYDSQLYGRDAVRHKFYRDAPMDPSEAKDVKTAPEPSVGFPGARMEYVARAKARAEERERATARLGS